MPYTHNRMPRKRAALVASLSLASLSSAIVLPPSTRVAGDVFVAGASSVRKTLNFGPNVKADTRSATNPSPALKLWNAAAPALSLASGDTVGKDLAAAFGSSFAVSLNLRSVANERLDSAVETLHPGAEFRLVDGYLSKHTNVFHAHFLQTVGGIDVANANLNVK